MCGIAGFLHFDTERSADNEVIQRMADTITHRGPDGEGFHVNKNIALGSRRLAIIDLDTGAQPMYNEDRSIVVVYNGEIYNYIELRKQLEGMGRRFRTTSDTEVIINAYMTWGFECQNHFNGMWAFALWDEKMKMLFISRDRIGEKPLYFSHSDNSLIFGSEIKALIKYGIPVNPNLEMLPLYMSMGFIPAPYTFYQDINQLLPGHYLVAKENSFKIHKFWDLPDITENNLSREKKQLEDQFKILFHDSVKIRMRSDVDFGAFLSGGLDSSCIVATMTEYASKPVQTFTIGFKNKEFDESELAKKVAIKFNTIHHEGTVTEQFLNEALDKIIFHYDDPFGDPSAIPTGQVAKYASDFVKMVLTGDGGDEVLSGYTTYQGEIFAQQYKALPKSVRTGTPKLIKLLARPLRGKMRYKLNRIIKVLEESSQSFEDRLFSKIANISEADMNELFNSKENIFSFHEYFSNVMKDCRFKDPFYKLMYFHLKVTLPYKMLTKVDRMSMAHSIEARIPFLDYRIIELLYGVHKDLKMNGYVTKSILRNTIANKTLPGELLKASKKGFNVPLRDWFKSDDVTKEILKTAINDGNAFYNTNTLLRLIKENKSGQSDRGSFIWRALVFNKWINEIEVKI